ncbi:hypothetical protein AB1N83_003596 [Pleurotus pulmonarius]
MRIVLDLCSTVTVQAERLRENEHPLCHHTATRSAELAIINGTDNGNPGCSRSVVSHRTCRNSVWELFTAQIAGEASTANLPAIDKRIGIVQKNGCTAFSPGGCCCFWVRGKRPQHIYYIRRALAKP